MDLNDALRKFDLIEANVAKLEAMWTKLEKLIPGSVAFFGGDCPEEREYRDLRRDYDAILEALPKIDGWTITARPYDLNTIAQFHFDAMDLGDGEVGAKVAVEETIHAPRRELDEYRHRLSRKRRELVRARLEELIVQADAALTEAMKSSGVSSRDDLTDARTPQLVGFERFVDEADRILGGSPRSNGWRRLRRHLNFATGVDLFDIVEYDWPEVKRELRELATERDPHPIDVGDVGDLVAAKPRGNASIACELPSGAMVHEIFVSYSSKDQPVADAAVAALEARGIQCWIASRDIIPGTEWSEAIIEGINGSRVMLLVYSQHANESHQIKREVERAVAKGVPIIPLRLQDVPLAKSLEYFISMPHWIDALTPERQRDLDYLADTVRMLLERQGAASARPPAPQPAPPAPATTRSRRQMNQVNFKIRNVVALKAGNPPVLMTVEGFDGSLVQCVWIDGGANMQHDKFSPVLLDDCTIPGAAPPPRQLAEGDTVGLPSGGLNNGMTVMGVNGDAVTCRWYDSHQRPRNHVFSIAILEKYDV